MIYILLVIIYLSFISLGLPDSLLGSAWPVMYKELNVSLSCSGIIFVIIYLGTITSSLCSERVIHKFGTGKTTFISVLMTAFGMLGFSLSHVFILLCIISIPYGLGAGSVDTALNNYVALHYESRHMSWLHCMWAVGASIGPYIMSAALKYSNSWNKGYRIVSYLQFGLSLILFLSLPMWNKKKNNFEEIKQNNEKSKEKTEETIEINSLNSVNSVEEEKGEISKNEINFNQNIDIGELDLDHTTDNLLVRQEKKKPKNESDTSINIKEEDKLEIDKNTEVVGLRKTIKLPGALEAMLFFFCYGAIEQTIGLWASSYLVIERDVIEVTASRYASLFYIGITVGRAVSGFITLRLNNNQMIYLGEGILSIGIIMILIPFGYWFTLIGFILSGLGCAPLYPCMIHSTPTTFGKDKSQAVIGVQMASSSIGVLVIPPLFGIISKWVGLKILPFYIGLFLVVMVTMHYKITKISLKKN
jgi:fucose permease